MRRPIIRALITGGAGFIGSHLVDEALRRGLDVVVLDDFSTGHEKNLAHCLERINLVRGDVRDKDVVSNCCRGVDLVFHHAALTAVPVSVDDPRLSAEVNDLGTLNVMLAAREAGVLRVVYASSSAVYGDNPELPHVETMPPTPNSPYAAHKLLGEWYGTMFGDLHGQEIVSLRYFNVFGPRQDPSSPYSGVISIFMERLSAGLPLTVYGDGGQSRDFVYVADVVAANFAAADVPAAAGKCFNIGVGRAVTLLEMIGILGDLVGAPVEKRHEPPRVGDVYHSLANVDRATEILGFAPGVSFRDGLARTYEWFKKTHLGGHCSFVKIKEKPVTLRVEGEDI